MTTNASSRGVQSGHTQSGKDIVALYSPQRKIRKSAAEIDNSADIAIGTRFAGLRCDVRVQPINLAFGKWRKNDTHKVSLPFARGAAGLNAAKDFLSRNGF